MTRRLGKIALVSTLALLACLALLMLCLPIYLNSGHFQTLATDFIDRSIPGAIRWQHADLSLYGGAVDIRALALAGPEGGEIAVIDRLAMRWRWRDLLRPTTVNG